MLKKLSLLLAFSVSSLAIANCDIDADLLNKSCSSEYFTPKNEKQLNEYLQYGKFKDGKLLNLELFSYGQFQGHGFVAFLHL